MSLIYPSFVDEVLFFHMNFMFFLIFVWVDDFNRLDVFKKRIFFFGCFSSFGTTGFGLIFVDLCAWHIQIPGSRSGKRFVVWFEIFLISDE